MCDCVYICKNTHENLPFVFESWKDKLLLAFLSHVQTNFFINSFIDKFGTSLTQLASSYTCIYDTQTQQVLSSMRVREQFYIEQLILHVVPFEEQLPRSEPSTGPKPQYSLCIGHVVHYLHSISSPGWGQGGGSLMFYL